MSQKPLSRYLLNSTTVFSLTLLVLGLTVIGVYLFGLGREHTFFQNSLLSTSILSVVFSAFVSIGLYGGVKLKDTLGQVTDKIPFRKKNKDGSSGGSWLSMGDFMPSFPGKSSDSSSSNSFDVGDLGGDEGCVGVLVGIVVWLAVALALSIALWLFGEILLVALFAFMAMLYWIFFRALRLVFRHSHQTRGRLTASIGYGLVYTLVYNSWIYAIFILVEYLRG
ncbi:hypothetical protein [Rufibacter sp. DG15C]|uniref:hypothetical protein n=1 Tax=Rufibacter sp. DG15C TaxID=1379909 RepID=UPI0008370DE0|nr:hypothetical protein [Rufibacter sp. DG15C]